ncbi:MAG: PD40 domain-containing protein [Acidobacteria bacterium]|nr:PD40 domain-containing protein [Acidobacteriota bacterium]
MRRILTAFVVIIVLLAGGVIAQQKKQQDIDLQAAIRTETVDGDLNGAIKQYGAIVSTYKADRAVAATALVHMAECYQKLGNAEAERIYERVLHEYADQTEVVAEVRKRLTSPGGASVAGISTRRLWDGSDIDVSSRPSGDGHYVSMVDYSTGNVALLDLTNGKRRLLTKGGPREGAIYSLITPDGRRVAYSWYGPGDAGDDTFELREVTTDGAAPRVLYRNPEIDYVQPTDWSSDGRRLLCVVARRDRTKQIAIFDVGSAAPKVLKTTDWNGPSRVMFSPDAHYLVYDLPQGEGAGPRDIFVMAADGSQENVLVRHPANDVVLGWTPDGTRILFQSDRAQSLDAWVIQVANGKSVGSPELVKRDVGSISPMGFTRSGAYYYGVSTTLRELYVASIDVREGRVAEAPAPISPNFVGLKLSADWSPDGRALAYAPIKQGEPSPIRIRDLASGDERELKTSLNWVQKLRWSPDGESLAFRANDPRHGWGIYRIALGTGDVTAIDPKSGVISDLAWSPDGMRIFYAQPGKVFLRELGTGQVMLIFPGQRTQWATYFAVSPEGRRIAVADKNDEAHWTALKVASISGELRELLRVQAPEDIASSFAWTRDGVSLIIARTSGRNPQAAQADLWRVPVDGSKPERLGLTMTEPTDLRLHPDGKQLAYVAGAYRAEVWVLENFLPVLNVKK